MRANAVEVGDDVVLTKLSMATAHALMTTLLSAEAIGVARWATDTASQYAKIREQFGRPIGQFQAIKHKCAEMIADTERATAAVWDAARALDEARERIGTQRVRTSSSPPRWRPRWPRPPPNDARRIASRCTAGSASPGSTTPTSITGGR